MPTVQETARDFLSLKRVAVAGVSRTESNAANFIYRTLRSKGYQAFAVNPKAETVEGDTCYPDLKSIPDKPDWVMIVTRPEAADGIVRECVEVGIGKVWMHNGMGTSVSGKALAVCRENGIVAIPGGCPMMFVEGADLGHRIMCWIQKLTGKLPKEINAETRTE